MKNIIRVTSLIFFCPIFPSEISSQRDHAFPEDDILITDTTPCLLEFILEASKKRGFCLFFYAEYFLSVEAIQDVNIIKIYEEMFFMY